MSRTLFRRLATGAATVALAAGLGSAVSTASADTTATASPISTKLAFNQTWGCSGGGNYFWCRG